GMALTADGTLFGAPRNAANGNVPVTFEVRDAVGSRASRQLSLRLIAPGAITFGTVFIPDALVGQEYLQDIAVKMQDGSALARPLTWRVTGTVPAGLVVTPQTELITVAGRPTQSGTFTFSIAVEDANGRSDTLDFTMTVHPPRYRVTTVMPEVVRPGETVTVALTASPNSTSLSWRVVGGTLPPGLTLDTAGSLTGTVAEDAPNGLHAFLVEVKDASGMSGITPLSLLVERAPRAAGCSAVGGAPMVFGLLALALLRRRRR
ncbi:MAG TPA: Ig domain-containing protein, partial [Archangium sp.]